MSSLAHRLEHVPAELEDTARRALELLESTLAESTRRDYARAWRNWCRFAQLHGFDQVGPKPGALVLYLTARAEGTAPGFSKLAPRSLQQQVSAINKAHELAGVASPTESPEVRAVMKGIRRTHGTPPKGKSPTGLRDLERLVGALPKDASGVRDRALLLLGFASAMRRSELVALDLEDLERREEGLVLLQRRSKTDQDGEGRRIGIPYAERTSLCPVEAVEAWVALLGRDSGPLFVRVGRYGKVREERLSDKGVALVVKRAATRAGMDPKLFAGHSLRSGFITEAARLGVPDRDIQRQSGHRSLRVLRGYIRHGTVFVKNAAGQVL